MGRSKRSGKPKYSQEVHATIVRHLKAGAFKTHAAQAAGISVDALDEWLKLGRAGDRRYALLAADVDRTVAEEACRQTAVISAAALKKSTGDWKAAAWLLERKYPKVYGRAAEPAVGVTIGNETDDDGEPMRTRVEFYIPDNGRRPVEE